MKTKITRKDLEKILLKLPRRLVLEFGLFCARDVEHLCEDVRVKACNDCLEGYLLGQRSLGEVGTAAVAAASAVHAAYADAYAAHAAVASAHAASAAASAHAASAAASAHAASAAVADATAHAAYAATASNKDLDFYHNHLLKMIKDLTEVEKLIWGIL